MDFDKEQGLKAKEVAESKIRGGDPEGAKKFLDKAERLCPGLEGIAQLRAVVQVHAAASVKINGETDWYAVLQLPPLTSDEALIKKAYRKLALLLHPDKNQAVGAEAAFKLISEAHACLSDHQKKLLHDVKRHVGLSAGSSRGAARGGPSAGRSPFAGKMPFGAQRTPREPAFGHTNGSRGYAPRGSGAAGASGAAGGPRGAGGMGSGAHEATNEPPPEGQFYTRCEHCQYVLCCKNEAMFQRVKCIVCNNVFTALKDSKRTADPGGAGRSVNGVPGGAQAGARAGAGLGRERERERREGPGAASPSQQVPSFKFPGSQQQGSKKGAGGAWRVEEGAGQARGQGQAQGQGQGQGGAPGGSQGLNGFHPASQGTQASGFGFNKLFSRSGQQQQAQEQPPQQPQHQSPRQDQAQQHQAQQPQSQQQQQQQQQETQWQEQKQEEYDIEQQQRDHKEQQRQFKQQYRQQQQRRQKQQEEEEEREYQGRARAAGAPRAQGPVSSANIVGEAWQQVQKSKQEAKEKKEREAAEAAEAKRRKREAQREEHRRQREERHRLRQAQAQEERRTGAGGRRKRRRGEEGEGEGGEGGEEQGGERGRDKGEGGENGVGRGGEGGASAGRAGGSGPSGDEEGSGSRRPPKRRFVPLANLFPADAFPPPSDPEPGPGGVQTSRPAHESPSSARGGDASGRLNRRGKQAQEEGEGEGGDEMEDEWSGGEEGEGGARGDESQEGVGEGALRPSDQEKESDFHNFDLKRGEDAFLVGQVWALYDPDELPRYYAKVTKVSRKPSFRCNVTWLEPKKPGHIPRHEGARDMEDMVQPATGCLYLSTLKELQTSASCFSHLVDPGPKSFPIMILPQPGEVWALFVPKFGVPPHKDREEEGDFEPLRKDVGRGERELVYALAMVDREVHEGTLRVVYLRKVAGYNSVYEHLTVGEDASFEAPFHRLSHLVPSAVNKGKERSTRNEFLAPPVRGTLDLDMAGIPLGAADDPSQYPQLFTRGGPRAASLDHREAA